MEHCGATRRNPDRIGYAMYMRALGLAVLLPLLFVGALAGDTREVIKTTVAGHETVYAEFIRGRSMRIEDLSQDLTGRCDYTHQNEKDGWYIPGEIGDASGSYHLAAYLGFGNGGICRDTVVRHGDPSPPGMSVRETDGSVTRDVLELSNGTLDSSLFEVPVGFKKVEALPGYRAVTLSERLGMEWTLLERAFESWFD